jgi:hypothetical protein
MSFQDIINKSFNCNINTRSINKMIFETLQNIYNFLCSLYNLCHNSLFEQEKVIKRDTHKDIHSFLLYITDKWNNNTIDDVELGSDIIYLFKKYSDKQKEINIQDNDMKCYMLGWYIYQTINNNNNNKSITDQ